MGGDLQSPPMASVRIATVHRRRPDRRRGGGVSARRAPEARALARREAADPEVLLGDLPGRHAPLRPVSPRRALVHHPPPGHRRAGDRRRRRPRRAQAERPGRPPQGRHPRRRGTGAQRRGARAPTATTTCASTCDRSTARSPSRTRVVLDDTPPVITVRSPAGATPVRYRVSERARVWAVARIGELLGPGDAPRASFRGRNGVVNFKPRAQIPPGHARSTSSSSRSTRQATRRRSFR